MLGVAEDLSVLRVHKVILCWEVSTRNGLLLGKKSFLSSVLDLC